MRVDSLTRQKRTHCDANSKLLERGTFETPQPAAGETYVTLDETELAMLLGGVSLASAKRRKRFALAS